MYGTRPQLVKLASVWEHLERTFCSVLVDSGQHYDSRLAGAFYHGEGLRAPDVHLGVRENTPAAQIGKIADALDRLLGKLHPDAVITFGDTSTTAGAAIAASYRGIPTAHIEAGMRSFDRTTPEEKNRVLADHLSTWRFCPTRTAILNLKREGLGAGVIGVGDVMYESFLRNQAILRTPDFPRMIELPEREYYFVTCHRAENIDQTERLKRLCEILAQLDRAVVFAVHPRARKNLIRHRLWARLKRLEHLRLTAPLNHQQTLVLAASARVVLTDSGGLQRESYWLRTPCLTLREQTEWVETVQCGANRLVGLQWDHVREAINRPWHIKTIRDPYFRNRSPVSRIVARLERDLTQ